MREIKFRVWDKKLKKFIILKEVDIFVNLYNKSMRMFLPNNFFETLELLLFTGFTDKNNRDIYVGDLLQEEDYENGETYIFEVVWMEEFAGFKLKRVDNRKIYPLNHKALKRKKIIGNIFENKKGIKR